MFAAYPEIEDTNLKGTLWTFEQWLAFKIRVRYGLSIVILFTASLRHFRDTCSRQDISQLDNFHT